MKQRLRTAILLAAGAGTKFWPYNVVRQKCAFPIAGIPLIRRLADDLHTLGIMRLVVVVGSGEASVRAALRGTQAELTFVRQATPSGTAPAVLLGAAGLDEDFLVLHADIATDPQNLEALMARFEQERPLAAALVQPLGQEPTHEWITAYAERGLLRGIEGHGRGGNLRLCGAYAMQPGALEFLRDNPGLVTSVPVGGMPPLEAEIAQSLVQMVAEGHPVPVVETSGYHVDLDKPWQILEANHQVIQAMSRRLEGNQIDSTARVHDSADINGRLILGPGAQIGKRVVVDGDLWLGAGASVTNGAMLLGPVVVGRETAVRDYSQVGGHSTLGAQGVYGHGAEFSGVALETVYCYHYCEIWGVVGQAVDFGAATVCGTLRFDDRETPWKINGRTEIPLHNANASYFGDYGRTGVNAIIMPGRRIGVYSCVGPGVVLYDDVPDRTLITVEQKLASRTWGPEQYGW